MNEAKFEFQLGLQAEDKVSGFIGILTARAEYLTGQKLYLAEPPVDKKGRMQESQWLNETEIIIRSDGIAQK